MERPTAPGGRWPTGWAVVWRQAWCGWRLRTGCEQEQANEAGNGQTFFAPGCTPESHECAAWPVFPYVPANFLPRWECVPGLWDSARAIVDAVRVGYLLRGARHETTGFDSERSMNRVLLLLVCLLALALPSKALGQSGGPYDLTCMAATSEATSTSSATVLAACRPISPSMLETAHCNRATW